MLKACQIPVWVSFTRRLLPEDDAAELLTAAGRWPALLDTGHNHCFSISADQTGLSDDQLYAPHTERMTRKSSRKFNTGDRSFFWAINQIPTSFVLL